MLYYLYGVIKDVHIEDIEKVPFNGIAGVISQVSPEEFGEVPLRQNLESLDWVREKVFNHERIIEDVMKKTTIIPMKFCTIFNSTERILQLLKDKYNYFTELLERFSNKHEWGFKIYCGKKPEVLTNVPASGREYLMAKKREEEKALEDERSINAYVEEIFKKVRSLAEDVRLNGPTPKELLPDKDKEQILNASFLVPDNNVDRLIALVNDMAKEDLKLELAGPLPVYSFVGGKDADNE